MKLRKVMILMQRLKPKNFSIGIPHFKCNGSDWDSDGKNQTYGRFKYEFESSDRKIKINSAFWTFWTTVTLLEGL